MNFGVGNHVVSYHGAGLGSVFGTLFRSVSPIVRKLFTTGKRLLASKASKSLLNEAKKSALKASLNVAEDALSGKPVLKSAERNLNQFGKNVVGKANQIVSRNTKRKRLPPPPKPAQKRRLLANLRRNRLSKPRKDGRSNDIFDIDD